MNNGVKIERLLDQGMQPSKIASRLGVSKRYVYGVRECGSYEGFLARSRSRYHRVARDLGIRQGRHRLSSARAYNYDADAIRAAVDDGATYGEAAKQFGVTRSVVAGLINRRPEGKP